MTDSWFSSQAKAVHPDQYLEGLRLFRLRDWQAAGSCFQNAERQAGPDHVQRNLYVSYYGLSLVYSNDLRGISLCRRAAAEELLIAGVFANLAHVEIKLQHRRRAVDAVRRGLRIDPGDIGLRNLRLHMGTRRPPILSFLDRDHVFNRVLGRLTYWGGAWRRQPFRAA